MISTLAALILFVHLCTASRLVTTGCSQSQNETLDEGWADTQVLLDRVQTFLHTPPEPNDVYDVFFHAGVRYSRQALSVWASNVVQQGSGIFHVCASEETFALDWSRIQPPITAQMRENYLAGPEVASRQGTFLGVDR